MLPLWQVQLRLLSQWECPPRPDYVALVRIDGKMVQASLSNPAQVCKVDRFRRFQQLGGELDKVNESTCQLCPV